MSKTGPLFSADDRPGRGSDQFALRFPEGMRDRLKAEAGRNGRSLNSEIIHRLEFSFHFDDHETHRGLIPDAASEPLAEIVRKVDPIITMLRVAAVAMAHPEMGDTYEPRDCIELLEIAADGLRAGRDRAEAACEAFYRQEGQGHISG